MKLQPFENVLTDRIERNGPQGRITFRVINEGQNKTKESPERRETAWSSRATGFSSFIIQLSKANQIPSVFQGSVLIAFNPAGQLCMSGIYDSGLKLTQVSKGGARSLLRGTGTHFKLEIVSSEHFHMEIGIQLIEEGKAAFSLNRMYCLQVNCWTIDWITECQIKFCCYNNQTNWPIKGWSWPVI